jgi:uridine kinase
MKPYVIGVCGRSCSGKSTIVEELEKQLSDVVCIQQDKFFKIPDDKYKHWESLEVLRNDKLIESIQKLKDGKTTYIPSHCWTETFDKLIYPSKYIVVEGYLLFAIDELLPYFDKKIWVDVSDEQILNRRLKRNRSNDYMDRPEYVMGIVIPESKKYESIQKSRADIIINGNLSVAETVKEFREKCCL